jgi:hypothetical protein
VAEPLIVATALRSETSDDAPESGVPATTRPVASIDRWTDPRLIAVGLTVAAVRFWFAADRRVFHVVADEPGQLAMARWLSGGTRWNMFDHSTWRPGYSVLLAPAYWFVDTGEGIVRAALTLNALLAGVSAMILARLLVRWTTSWRRPRRELRAPTVDRRRHRRGGGGRPRRDRVERLHLGRGDGHLHLPRDRLVDAALRRFRTSRPCDRGDGRGRGGHDDARTLPGAPADRDRWSRRPSSRPVADGRPQPP